MHAAGFPWLSGEAVMAGVTIALENKLIDRSQSTRFWTSPQGAIRAHPHVAHRDEWSSVQSRTFRRLRLLRGFVPAGAWQARRRAVRVDIAFGGEFYAIVDSESVGIPLDTAHAQQLIRRGRREPAWRTQSKP